MSLGTGQWKIAYDTGTSTDFFQNIKSIVTKEVKYDSILKTTIDGNNHALRDWKYITYTIVIDGWTRLQWLNVYEVFDGKIVQFYEHEDNVNFSNCYVESVKPYFKNNRYDKPMIELKLTTISPTIETLVTPTGADTQGLPPLDEALGNGSWVLFLDGDDYVAGSSWNLTDYGFNTPAQIINKSVLTGKRWLTRKGVYNKHKIVIKEPNTALVTALLNNVGSEVTFTPFNDNIAFNEVMILRNVNYFNAEGMYIKNSIEFELISKGYTSIIPI